MSNYMDLRRYHQGAAIPQDIASIRTQQPFDRSSLEQNVWVVFWQAFIPAAGIATLCLVAYFIALEWVTIPVKSYQVILAWLGILLMSFINRWNKLLTDSNERLWKIEEIVNRDIDGDGKIGKPDSLILRGIIQNEDGGVISGTKHLMPFSKDRFLMFCRGVELKGLSYRSWTGSGGVFTDSEFEALMNFLIENKFARWVNPTSPNQGRELTELGKRAIAQYSKQLPEEMSFYGR